MKIPELFKFNKRGRVYYFYLGNRKCESCGKEITEPLGVLYFFWDFKNSKKILLHSTCIKDLKKIQPSYKVKEQYSVLFAEEIPQSSIPVFISPPTLKNAGNKTVFSASELETNKTTDKTIYAGRESLNGVSIGLISDDRALMLDKEILQLEKNKREGDKK